MTHVIDVNRVKSCKIPVNPIKPPFSYGFPMVYETMNQGGPLTPEL